MQLQFEEIWKDANMLNLKADAALMHGGVSLNSSSESEPCV